MTTELQPQEILEFWFSELAPKQWFNGGDEVDELIRGRFESAIEQALNGMFDSWLASASGYLALILILDQFPRNIYRGTPRSFAYDHRALALTLDGIARGLDETLKSMERAFFYLPLEHCEDLLIQERSVERYAKLVCQTSPSKRDGVRMTLDYAWRHYVIIKEFGRYPHRNAILGRASTPEEVDFLNKPGSSF